jgi:hypothetical protein
MADPEALDDFLSTAPGLTTARSTLHDAAVEPDVARPTSYATNGPRRRKPVGERWEDRHVRRTFHLSSDLVDRFSETAAAEGMSMSGAAAEAIDQWVRRKRRG